MHADQAVNNGLHLPGVILRAPGTHSWNLRRGLLPETENCKLTQKLCMLRKEERVVMSLRGVAGSF